MFRSLFYEHRQRILVKEIGTNEDLLPGLIPQSLGAARRRAAPFFLHVIWDFSYSVATQAAIIQSGLLKGLKMNGRVKEWS